MQTQVLTVSELTQAIKQKLEEGFPFIKLQGEISNFKRQSSGHLYFSLKDSAAQISAVMFRGNACRLTKLPKDGDQVQISGELNVFAPGGRYQIVVHSLKQVGLGELLLKLEELKQKLHKKGWFSQKHKKPIPKFPKKIGVITSPTGAAIQDILNILRRRCAGFHLILNPVKVQGEGSAQEIAQAIYEMNKHKLVDVLIVGRGGGSIEDLWAFNEEIVAEAIFNSKIPIIAAVGHETDHCIADYVADLRAPTPSAAAEIVSAEKEQQIQEINQMSARLTQAIEHLFRHARQSLQGVLRHPFFVSPYALLGPWIQKTDDLRIQIDQVMLNLLTYKKQMLISYQKHLMALKPKAQIENLKQHLKHQQNAIDRIMIERLNQYNLRLEALSQSFQLIDPKHLLNRGYSILFSEDEGSVISSVKNVKKDSTLVALVSDGKVITKVKETTRT